MNDAIHQSQKSLCKDAEEADSYSQHLSTRPEKMLTKDEILSCFVQWVKYVRTELGEELCWYLVIHWEV